MNPSPSIREPVILAGTAHPDLGAQVAAALGTSTVKHQVQRFPDGELEVAIESPVRGSDVFIVQSTAPPVGENLLELLLTADACERAGARTLTAVVSYFGYARQDRRRKEGHPHGARVMANALQSHRFARLLTVDLHSAAVEGFLNMPVENLTALGPLIAQAKAFVTPQSVIVSPDFGAAKLAEAFSSRLNLPMSITHKTRLSGSQVHVRGVVGDVQGKAPLLVDDLISTGGTIVAAAEALREAGCANDITVIATHGLLVGDAVQKLKAAGITRLVTADTVPSPHQTTLPHHVVPIAPLLADVIGRLRDGRPLGDLLADR